MKHPKIFKLILIVLIIFFSLQFTSHVFLKLGLNKENPPRSGMLKASALVFPLDAELIYEHAFALLEEHAYLKGSDRPDLNESVQDFKRSIKLNPLLYNAHFNLAKACQLNQNDEATLFDDAFKYLKRAVFIRGNLAHISVEVIKQLLSLWPFLNHEDKEFCKQLLVKSIPSISNADFTAILNVWGIYSKDIEMLKKALVKKPQFYREISKKLEQLELDLKTRQKFLASYEDYYLDYFQERFPDYLKKSTDKLKTLRSWNRRLKNNIPGYFKLTKNKDFNLSIYRELKQTLITKIIDFLFKENKNKLGDTILSYLNDCDSEATIDQVYQFLKTKNFFNKPDLKKQFLEMVIHTKLGDMNQVIQQGEEIRHSMSFVREDQKDNYTKILMLLIEAYLQSNQINRAEAVLQEVEKISPESGEVVWLKCKMLHVKGQMFDVAGGWGLVAKGAGQGEENEFKVQGSRFKVEKETSKQVSEPKTKNSTPNTQQKDQEEKYELIRNSRVVELKRTRIKKIVYFFDEPMIIIQLSEKFREKIKNKHLLQVFLNGWIYYEQYLSNIEDKVEVKVEEGEWKKVEVEIKIR